MMSFPPCPICNSQYTYENKKIFNCSECAHEWIQEDSDISESIITVRDAVGNILQDGDAVIVVKDLKVKGSSQVVKVGTKVKNIRLVEGGHDIDCKIDGIGSMGLKAMFVKKV